MNKYINYINDNLTYKPLIEIKKNYKNLNIFSLRQIDGLKIISKNQLRIKIDNKIFYIFYTDLIDSGKNWNNNKRVIISKTKSIQRENDINFQPLFFYYAGNKFCYVKFHSDKDFIWNETIKNRSIWVNFIDIFACLKYSLNIKTDRYLISQNLKEIMFEFDNFDYLSKKDYEKFKKEIDDFSNNNFVVPNNLFDLKSKNSIKDNKEIGKITENLINKLLNDKNEQKIFENKFDKIINKIRWNNHLKESYLPYDFLINDNIFLEVKGTNKEEFNFILTDSEWKFKEEQKNNYFLINVCWKNIKNNEYKLNLYNYNELNNCHVIEKTKYFFKNKNKEK